MSHTDFYRHENSTDSLYAVPLTDGAWTAVGAITGDDSAIPGLYVFPGLNDASAYEIRIQAGGSPVSTDDPIGSFPSLWHLDVIALAAAIAEQLAGTTIVVNSPVFSGVDGEDLEVEQGDHYAETPARIDIESVIDYTGKYFVLAARLSQGGSSGMALRMLIRSDAQGQFALFAPTSEQTELWTPGTWDLRHRIELAANHFRTVKRGRLTVRPFDTPATVYAVDPPAGP